MPEQRTWTRGELPAALNVAIEAAIERGARAPVVLRLTEVAGYTDWALLMSARSDRQVRGVVEGVREALAQVEPEPTPEGEPGHPVKLLGADGLDHNLWALLDYDDFLIHVFYHPVRRHYDLESMWSDAPRVELDLPEDVLDASDLDVLDAPEVMPDYRGEAEFGGFADEFVDDDDDYDYDDEDDDYDYDEDARPLSFPDEDGPADDRVSPAGASAANDSPAPGSDEAAGEDDDGSDLFES